LTPFDSVVIVRAMKDVLADAREVVEWACAAERFPPPSQEQSLMEWASNVLSVALAPVGSPHWNAGREHCVDAVELALVTCSASTHGVHAVIEAGTAGESVLGALSAIRRHLAIARELAEKHGRAVCACSTPGHAIIDHVGRRRCVKCLSRLQ